MYTLRAVMSRIKDSGIDYDRIRAVTNRSYKLSAKHCFRPNVSKTLELISYQKIYEFC